MTLEYNKPKLEDWLEVQRQLLIFEIENSAKRNKKTCPYLLGKLTAFQDVVNFYRDTSETSRT